MYSYVDLTQLHVLLFKYELRRVLIPGDRKLGLHIWPPNFNIAIPPLLFHQKSPKLVDILKNIHIFGNFCNFLKNIYFSSILGSVAVMSFAIWPWKWHQMARPLSNFDFALLSLGECFWDFLFLVSFILSFLTILRPFLPNSAKIWPIKHMYVFPWWPSWSWRPLWTSCSRPWGRYRIYVGRLQKT